MRGCDPEQTRPAEVARPDPRGRRQDRHDCPTGEPAENHEERDGLAAASATETARAVHQLKNALLRVILESQF